MIAGAEGPAADEPGDALSDRRHSLAAQLQETATALKEAHRKLTRSRARQTVMLFWRQGLEEMWGHIDTVQLLLDECESVIEDEAEAAGGTEGVGDWGQAEPQDDADTRLEAFRQLDQAVTLAVRDYNAARHALEIPDQPSQQSDLFVGAVANLLELAGHCDALAVHMRGPEGLGRGV